MVRGSVVLVVGFEIEYFSIIVVLVFYFWFLFVISDFSF